MSFTISRFYILFMFYSEVPVPLGLSERILTDDDRPLTSNSECNLYLLVPVLLHSVHRFCTEPSSRFYVSILLLFMYPYTTLSYLGMCLSEELQMSLRLPESSLCYWSGVPRLVYGMVVSLRPMRHQ